MENKIINSVRGGFWTKPVIIFVLLLLLLIPLGFISSMISDRAYVKRSAEESIMQPVGGELRIEGVLISVPYKKQAAIYNENGVAAVSQTTEQIMIMPQSYELSTELNPQYLKRGIFSVPVFNGDVALKAKFAPLNFEQLNIKESDVLLGEATLILGVGSKKTFTAFPALKANGEDLAQSFAPPKYSPFAQSVHYKLPANLANGGFELAGALSMQGGQSASFVPVGQDNKFDVKSSWSSPSFSGGWLPKSREVTSSGFNAQWEISGLSTGVPQAWIMDGRREMGLESVEASFISPVNNYSLIARCVTYAILFLAVPFLAIFLCEIYSRARIHPIQYLLIGAADVLFYLLVLSFSEHISFLASYLIAAAAVCATILFYGSAIFRARKWGVFIALVHTVSYCLLYGILQSEDYALLMGSVMIFAVIALVMYLTRKIDWYENGLKI